MSNQSEINSSFTLVAETPTLNQLLDSLGFDQWKTIISSFVLPAISFLGLILCSISAWIFYHKKFKDPVFYYYRLLCLVYIIHLMHNIPRGILFSPRYLPNINTYLSSIYLMYYASMSYFLFHFEETLQIAILLTRMKIYNSFVRKHFSSKPWIICLCFFLTCLFIDAPLPFAFKVDSIGTYYVYDESLNGTKQNRTLYFFIVSDFSTTLYGRVILAFTGPFLNLFLSIVIGIILNIVSVCLYRSYVRERRKRDEAYSRIKTNHHKSNDQAKTSSAEVIRAVDSKPRKITLKEINENKSEKNMFYMALTLCSISIVSRILFIFTYIYMLFFNSFSGTLILLIFSVSIYTIVPSVAILVFYSFNKMFREEFKKKFFNQKRVKIDQCFTQSSQKNVSLK
jgi:hypothetical protein